MTSKLLNWLTVCKRGSRQRLVIVLAVLFGMMFSGEAQRERWQADVPTVVLLALYQYPSLPGHEEAVETLDDRVRQGNLSEFEWSRFRRINNSRLDISDNFIIRIPERQLAANPIGYRVMFAPRSALPPGIGPRRPFTPLDSGSVGIRVTPRIEGADAFDGALVWSPRFFEVRAPHGHQRTTRLGHLDPGDHRVLFDIEMRIARSEKNAPGPVIWSGTIAANMMVHQSPEDVLQRIDDERFSQSFREQLVLTPRLRGNHWIGGNSMMWGWTRLPREVREIVTAGTLELFRDDRLAATADVIVRGGRFRVIGAEVLHRGALHFDFLEPAAATWRVRYRSHGALMYHHVPEATEYWHGTIEVPMVWDVERRRLVSQSMANDR